MAKRRKKALVIRALMMADDLRKPPPGLIRHSNRGSQYASHDYQKLLKQHEAQRQLQLLGQYPIERTVRGYFHPNARKGVVEGRCASYQDPPRFQSP